MRDDQDTVRRPHEAAAGLPARIYWRRRLLVAVTGLALVVLTVRLLPTGGGPGNQGGGSAHPQPDPRPAAATNSPQKPSPRPTVTVTVTATPKVTVTATPDPVGTPCRKAGMRIGVKPNKNAYGKGEQPRLTVRAVPNERCWLDPSRLELTVSSGDDRIWSSGDCPEAGHKPVRVTPKFPYKNTIAWPRVRSNPALCAKKAPAPQSAQPGWYVAAVSLGGNSGGEGVFRLR